MGLSIESRSNNCNRQKRSLALTDRMCANGRPDVDPGGVRCHLPYHLPGSGESAQALDAANHVNNRAQPGHTHWHRRLRRRHPAADNGHQERRGASADDC